MKYLFVFLLLGLVSCGDASSNASENVKPKLKEYSMDDVTSQYGLVLLKKDMKPVTGIVRDLYEDGQLKHKENYKDGKLNGLKREWYKDGQLHCEFNYKDGKHHGLSRRWLQNGQLCLEWNYKDGERISQKCWDKNGKEIPC